MERNNSLALLVFEKMRFKILKKFDRRMRDSSIICIHALPVLQVPLKILALVIQFTQGENSPL